MSRSFLFLQGVNTPFFPRLADKLIASGHRVHRVNFNVGDTVFWGSRSNVSFRGALKTLPDFFAAQYDLHRITDIVLFGDRRPIHLPAITLAKQKDIRVHVFEEGYFRPHWITLERNGVNANSLLPRDPAWFMQAAKNLPDALTLSPFTSTLKTRALYDMAYHLVNGLSPIFFPRYRTHRPVLSVIEYLGWARRFAMMPRYESRDRVAIAHAMNGSARYFLLPLQLDSDAQIRDHSPFKNMSEVIELVMTSFAHHAAKDVRLIIKNHPLDTGFTSYARLIKTLGTKFDMLDRIDYLESGDLDVLLNHQHACGLVTVNSTVGLSSLGFNCPTITLSEPIYDMAGLTFAGHLDSFWRNATPPDAALFNAFKKVLMHTTQINGGYYSPSGIEVAVENAVNVMTAEQSTLEALL